MLEQNLNETIIRFHKKTNEYVLNNRVLGVEEVKTFCELSQRDVRIVTTEKRKRISLNPYSGGKCIPIQRILILMAIK